MKKLMLITAALAVILTGCGKNKNEDDVEFSVSFSSYITDKDGNIISDGDNSSDTTSENVKENGTDEAAFGWDIAEKYKDFLDYTFGGSYVLTPRGTETYEAWDRGPCGSTVWKVTYPNYMGELSSTEYRSFEFTDSDADYFADEKAMNDNTMFTFITGLISDKAEAEFAENILSKYYDGTFDNERNRWVSDDVDVMLMVYSPLTDEDPENRIISDFVSPDTGLKYMDMGLKEVAESPDFIFTLFIMLRDDRDPAEYVDTAKKLKEDFIEYTGTPLNYSFGVEVSYVDNSGDYVNEYPLEDRTVLGEKYEDSDGHKYIWKIWQYYEEKYGIQIEYN